MRYSKALYMKTWSYSASQLASLPVSTVSACTLSKAEVPEKSNLI